MAAHYNTMIRGVTGGMAVLFGTLGAGFAAAQDFPSGNVTIIVPFSPGGGVDAIARIVANDLREQWSVPVVVENLPGGSGMIAAAALKRAAPDGHTLMLASAGELAVNTTLLQDSLTYDVAAEFAPVALAARIPNVFVVGSGSSIQSVEEFVSAAKEDPGALSYGSSGIGNPQHLNGELLGHLAGVELVHIPYRGASQQVVDTMAGHIDATFASVSAVMGNIGDGMLRPIGVTSSERLEALPDVPAIAETPGLKAYELVNWFGFVTRTDTPLDRIEALHAAIAASLQNEASQTRLQAMGAEYVPMSVAEFEAYLAEETEKFATIIEEAGIQPE